MKPYVIITDSSSDLSPELIKQADVKVLSLYVQIEGEESVPNSELDIKYFYSKIREGKTAVTSAINYEEFRVAFENELAKGKDILYIGFSSALSATYNVGATVAKDLMTEHPGSKIYTVDSLAASLGEGLLVYLCGLQRQKGKSIEDVRDYAENMKLKIAHWFTVDDLHQLRRGGRLSSTAAIVGTLVGVKPVLHVDNLGRLVPVSKIIGRKKAIRALVDNVIRSADNIGDQTLFLTHSDCLEDAMGVREMLVAGGAKDVIIADIGPVIGAHTGVGTIAIFSVANTRD